MSAVALAAIPDPRFLSLTATEKEILQAIYSGIDVADLPSYFGTSRHAIATRLSRACKREGAKNTMRLVIRYIDEYLGVGEAVEFRALRHPAKPTNR